MILQCYNIIRFIWFYIYMHWNTDLFTHKPFHTTPWNVFNLEAIIIIITYSWPPCRYPPEEWENLHFKFFWRTSMWLRSRKAVVRLRKTRRFIPPVKRLRIHNNIYVLYTPPCSYGIHHDIICILLDID